MNKKQSAVIDRIVDQVTAVLLLDEGQRQLTIPVKKLPPRSKEGSWLLVYIKDGELIDAELDLEKTGEIRERISNKRALLLERMARRKNAGD